MTEQRLMQEAFKWHWNVYPEQRGLFFRIKNEGTNRISGAIGKATGIIAGVADCCMLALGTAIFIEFKTSKGKQSVSQKKWQQAIEDAGYHHYYIIRSLEEFQDLCQARLDL